MNHPEPSPLAGKTVHIEMWRDHGGLRSNGPTITLEECYVVDWWDRIDRTPTPFDGYITQFLDDENLYIEIHGVNFVVSASAVRELV